MTKPTATTPLPQAALQLRRQAIEALTAGQLNEGIALLEKALGVAPDSGELHNDLGTANWQRGNPGRAEMHYRRAIQLQPRNAYALNAYGAFCLEQWRLKEAEELLKRAFAVKQDHHEILNNIGLLHYRLRNFADAEKFLLHSIRLAPQWPNPYLTLGNVLQACRSTKKAEAAYRQALKLNPRNAAAWNDAGYFFFTLHRDEEAAECFRRCISIDPSQQSVWGRYLGLLERTSQLETAAEVLKDAKRRFPHCPSIITQEVKLLRRQGKADEGIALMESCRSGIDAQQKGSHSFISEFYFELGQLYDRKGEADKAFECFTLSNEIEGRNVDASAGKVMSDGLKRLMREFTADMAKGPAPAQLPEGMPQPVFLVGFPRSGTTLLDQILSSHPDIIVAEERGVINIMAEELRARLGGKPNPATQGFWDNPAYPSTFTDFSEGDVAALQALFYKEHGVSSGGKKIFVDKLPLNIFHAGFIKRVFPQAKIILALRHPCDSILSCYMQRFNLNAAMMNFMNLADAAAFYDDTFSLWEHYQRTVDLDVHSIRYEDVVADFRPTVAALLEALDVAWDERVMEYDKTAAARGRINTPSYHQVTEKIYNRASGRWLRYRRHLEPVLPLLAAHAERYGYTIDEAEAAE